MGHGMIDVIFQIAEKIRDKHPEATQIYVSEPDFKTESYGIQIKGLTENGKPIGWIQKIDMLELGRAASCMAEIHDRLEEKIAEAFHEFSSYREEQNGKKS